MEQRFAEDQRYAEDRRFAEDQFRGDLNSYMVSMPAGCGPASLTHHPPPVALDSTMQELRGVRSDHGLLSSHCLPLPLLPPTYADIPWGSGSLDGTMTSMDGHHVPHGPCQYYPASEASLTGMGPRRPTTGLDVPPPWGHGGHYQQRQFDRMGGHAAAMNPQGMNLRDSSQQLSPHGFAQPPYAQPGYRGGAGGASGAPHPEFFSNEHAQYAFPHGNVPGMPRGLSAAHGGNSQPHRPMLAQFRPPHAGAPDLGGSFCCDGATVAAAAAAAASAAQAGLLEQQARAAPSQGPSDAFNGQFIDSSTYLASPEATERPRDYDSEEDSDAEPPLSHRFIPPAPRRQRSKDDVEASCIRCLMPSCLVTC